jgi:hypothetical protein
MGIQDHFFPPPDPAREWKALAGLRPECILDEPSFGGLRMGDPADSISRLGPPENPRPTRDGMYDYPSRGFEIDTTDGRIDCFLFRWDAQDPAKHFKGDFLWKGAPLKLDGSTREVDLRSFFGEPYWIDDDLGERLFFYEFGGGTLEWQVELTRGHLTVLTLVTPPLLSDPGQRTAYGITRPWPPLQK